jgi:hypothetical protein
VSDNITGTDDLFALNIEDVPAASALALIFEIGYHASKRLGEEAPVPEVLMFALHALKIPEADLAAGQELWLSASQEIAPLGRL